MADVHGHCGGTHHAGVLLMRRQSVNEDVVATLVVLIVFLIMMGIGFYAGMVTGVNCNARGDCGENVE
jgi:hypothetical protein